MIVQVSKNMDQNIKEKFLCRKKLSIKNRLEDELKSNNDSGLKIDHDGTQEEQIKGFV